VIRVAILALDAATRGDIASTLKAAPGLEVVGAAEDEAALVHLLESVRVNVIVMAAGLDATPAVAHWLAEEAIVVAIVADRAQAAAALRGGVRAVLLDPVDGAELLAAIRAVAVGLLVLPADLLEALLQPRGSHEAQSAGAASVEALTPRELEVLALIVAGASNKLIAQRLGISVHTAKFHVAGLFEKLGAGSRAEAVGIAARLGLVLL
jgi:DNA-binding NarL/FixJ family response regulator